MPESHTGWPTGPSRSAITDRPSRIPRRSRAGLVAVLHPAPLTPWAVELSRQLGATAERHGSTAIHLQLRIGDEDRVTRQLIGGLVDGVIEVGAWLSAEQRAAAAERVALTVVAEDLWPRRYDLVRQHIAAGLRSAVGDLAARGLTRIGLLGNGNLERRTGYLAGLAEAGIAPEPLIMVEAGETGDAMLRAAFRLLRQRPRPEAIIAGTDRGAIATLWAAHAVGLTVPGDLAVIGAGNIPEGQAVYPALTTIGPAELDFTEIIDRLFAESRIRDCPASPCTRPGS
jgi:DNA-binding LacI/PurR family transcriptional regulator